MRNNNHLQKDIRSEIIGISFIALALLLFLCIINPSVGVLSKYISKGLKILTGEGRYLLPVALGTSGLYLILHKKKKGKQKGGGSNIYGFLLLFIVALAVMHLSIPLDYYLSSGLQGDGGGIVGAIFSYILYKSFGPAGTYIILATITLVAILILTNKSIVWLVLGLWSKISSLFRNFHNKITGFFYEEIPEKYENNQEKNLKWDNKNENLLDETYEEQAAGLEYSMPVEEEKDVTELAWEMDTQVNSGDKDTSSRVINISKSEPDSEAEYVFPPLSLLAKPQKKDNKAEKDINRNVKKLESTLESFGVKAKVSRVAQGPTITRYEIQPPPGIKVSKIVNLADDIALGMAAPDVRIEAPIPGKAAMGIEVPNKEIYTVYFRELIESHFFNQSSSKLTLALGKDVAGKPITEDLQKMPHLLIAGATGSGKSVCLNTIIASILFKADPTEVKFLIIDPKMVELAIFNGIPHLVSPVVSDPKKAATTLRWAVREMENRYEIFANAGVRDIYRYNNLVKKRGENESILPLIVIIIDELADLMMVSPAEVEDTVCRLAQMSRAAGMHLVIATQRPSVDVITGLIKANIPSRISFAVSSGIDSRTIMDVSGAEKLLGKGDMLFYPVGAAKPKRVQGAFLADNEVELLVEHLKKQAAPSYNEKIIEENEKESTSTKGQLEDVLLPKAISVIIESGQASISMLQRRLHVGYSRAARLIDIMERKGIVGEFEGSKPREVLITREQYEKTYKNYHQTE